MSKVEKYPKKPETMVVWLQTFDSPFRRNKNFQRFVYSRISNVINYVILSQNPLLEGGDLSTMIGVGTGDASFDANGRPLYKNRRQVISSFDLCRNCGQLLFDKNQADYCLKLSQ